MIASLRGLISKHDLGEVEVGVHGVGYRVRVPVHSWEQLPEGKEMKLFITSYVREDRFDLYGFTDRQTKLLFEELIERQGIGPKLGLELCAVSRSLLRQAMDENDPGILTSIKGIGRKTAEKLLIELRTLGEKYPHMFQSSDGKMIASSFDADALAALIQLGYNRSEVMSVLSDLPKDLETTEARVTAALRSL